MTVKLRTVNTHELGFASDSDAASTAHSCSVNHYGVERHICRYIVFLCQQAAELHHDCGTDGKALVNFLSLNNLLDSDSHNTFLTIASVVSHYNDFVGMFAHLVLEDDKFFCSAGKYRYYTVSCGFESLYDWKHRSYAHTTSGTNHGAEVLNMGGLAERSDYVCYVVAFIQVT